MNGSHQLSIAKSLYGFYVFRSPTLDVGPCQDKFVRRCRVISQEISEEHMEVEGEFLTLDEMIERKFSKRLR